MFTKLQTVNTICLPVLIYVTIENCEQLLKPWKYYWWLTFGIMLCGLPLVLNLRKRGCTFLRNALLGFSLKQKIIKFNRNMLARIKEGDKEVHVPGVHRCKGLTSLTINLRESCLHIFYWKIIKIAIINLR